MKCEESKKKKNGGKPLFFKEKNKKVFTLLLFTLFTLFTLSTLLLYDINRIINMFMNLLYNIILFTEHNKITGFSLNVFY